MNAELSARAQFQDRIRSFNRQYFNPFAMSFAGRPGDFWSVILHTGRRSGKQYTTPVAARLHEGSVIIPLPYAKKTDWALNVMAISKGTLIHQGKVYSVSQPEIIPFSEVRHAFSGIVQGLLERSDTLSCLHLGKFTEVHDGESIYQSFVQAHPRERGFWALATAACLLVGIGLLLRQLRK